MIVFFSYSDHIWEAVNESFKIWKTEKLFLSDLQFLKDISVGWFELANLQNVSSILYKLLSCFLTWSFFSRAPKKKRKADDSGVGVHGFYWMFKLRNKFHESQNRWILNLSNLSATLSQCLSLSLPQSVSRSLAISPYHDLLWPLTTEKDITHCVNYFDARFYWKVKNSAYLSCKIMGLYFSLCASKRWFFSFRILLKVYFVVLSFRNLTIGP